MYRELLNRMIDKRLQNQAADKARLAVTAEEVDRGLKNKAASLGLTVKDLLAEAKRQGLVEADYRDEVRRQLLEGKLIQLRVMSRVRVSEDDARNEYARWVGQLTNTLFVRPLHDREAHRRHGRHGSERGAPARGRSRAKGPLGHALCKVVEQYSKDVQTKNVCGSRGLQPMTALFPELEAAVKTLRPGEVSDPIVIAGQAVLVVSITKAPRTPAFEEVREQMQERAPWARSSTASASCGSRSYAAASTSTCGCDARARLPRRRSSPARDGDRQRATRRARALFRRGHRAACAARELR